VHALKLDCVLLLDYLKIGFTVVGSDPVVLIHIHCSRGVTVWNEGQQVQIDYWSTKTNKQCNNTVWYDKEWSQCADDLTVRKLVLLAPLPEIMSELSDVSFSPTAVVNHWKRQLNLRMVELERGQK